MFFKIGGIKTSELMLRDSKLKKLRGSSIRNSSCFNTKNMKVLNGFLGIIVMIVVLKWFLPPEAVSLASDILIKVLTLVKDLLAQVNLPQ
jgi:hypothetical protein